MVAGAGWEPVGTLLCMGVRAAFMLLCFVTLSFPVSTNGEDRP